MYSGIKSYFVKSELKKTSFRNRKYIDDLMKIEDLANGVSWGRLGWHFYHLFPHKYVKQWKAIWLELNPKGHKEWLIRHRKEETRNHREQAKIELEEKEELQQEKREWKKEK